MNTKWLHESTRGLLNPIDVSTDAILYRSSRSARPHGNVTVLVCDTTLTLRLAFSLSNDHQRRQTLSVIRSS